MTTKDSIKSTIDDPKNLIAVSVASAWEIAIKLKVKKTFKLKSSLETCFKAPGIKIIDINLNHVFELAKLPLLHKDPFDRILISQAKVENLTFITADNKITKYKVKTLRA